jgi:hypothetical protein
MKILRNKQEQAMNAGFVHNDPKQVDERRKALKAIGKFGLYTAPALLATLKSARASDPSRT